MALKVHLFTTLDGSISAPMWTIPYPFTDEQTAATAALTAGATAILLGRQTFQEMGPAWTSRGDDVESGAAFFNGTRKHVVSSTLEKAEGWENSRVLGAYDPEAVRALVAAEQGDVYVTGSGTLVRALLADGLVDELHLFLYPVAVGVGPRLFLEGTETTLTLLAGETYPNGVAHLTYGPPGR